MHLQVNPNIRKEKWTEDEDRRLLKLVKQYGNAWAEISRCLDGRTDQQVLVHPNGQLPGRPKHASCRFHALSPQHKHTDSEQPLAASSWPRHCKQLGALHEEVAAPPGLHHAPVQPVTACTAGAL